MTQPIQEPTPGREVSGLGYGSRQLFRRPAPVSATASNDFPYAYMAWYDGDTVPTDTTYTPAPFEEYFINPAGVEDNGLGQTKLAVNLATSRILVRPNETLQYDWIVTVTAGWAESPAAFTGDLMVGNLVGVGAFFGNFDVHEASDADIMINWANNQAQAVTVLRANNSATSAVAQAFLGEVVQTTGGDIFLGAMVVECQGIPAFPYDEGSFFP